MSDGTWSTRDDDAAAVERYRYLLRTADPDTIEQVHREAFDRLTPEQRQMVYEELAIGAERPASADSAALARSATRAELRQPGFLERTFGGSGFGTAFGGSMLGSIAGMAVGSVLLGGVLPSLGRLFGGGLHGAGFEGGGFGGGPGGPGFGGGPGGPGFGGGPGGFGGGPGGPR